MTKPSITAPYLTLEWWRETVDPRVTSVQVDARSDNISISAYWHENYLGGFDCKASLHGEGTTVEDAIAALRGSADKDPHGRTIAQRFQDSVDWYAKHTYVRYDLDPGEIEEIAVMEKEAREQNLAVVNAGSRKIEDRIFEALKKRGYTFRFRSCAPFHAQRRDKYSRLVAVDVIDQKQGEALEAEWAANAKRRESGL